MKKYVFLLSTFTLALTACSNNNKEAAGAEITSVGAPAWQTEVQSAEMPSSMTQPTYQPSYQPTYAPQPAPVPAMPAPAAQPMPQAYNQSESIGNCQVVRDGNNAPIYAQIQKGCYTEANYTVGKHDTVFLVAYLSGKSVSELAALNQLSQPYQLKPGQVLRLR